MKKGKASTNSLNVFFLEPPAVEQVLNTTVVEGGDVTKECNVTAGTPPPTILWRNINTSEVIYGKLLNITNIRRNQSGEYRCFANNTCGNDSSTMFIDVQCKGLHLTSFFIVCMLSLGLVMFAVRWFAVCFTVYMYLLSLSHNYIASFIHSSISCGNIKCRFDCTFIVDFIFSMYL